MKKTNNKTNNKKKLSKSELLQNWQKLVVTYNKMCEHPTVKAIWWFCIELLKVCIRLALRKYLADYFEDL